MNRNGINKIYLTILCIITLFCLSGLVFATEDPGEHGDGGGEGTGSTHGVNTSTSYHIPSDGSGTGTMYHFNVNGQTYDLNIPAGESVGPLNGYLSIDEDNYNVPQGDIEITREDFATALEAAGEHELAEKIKNGEQYHVKVEQSICIAPPGGKYEYMGMQKVNNLINDQGGYKEENGNLYHDLYDVVNSSNGALFDVADNDDEFADYYRWFR